LSEAKPIDACGTAQDGSRKGSTHPTHWLACALSAAVTLAGVWLLFARLLRLELYPGLLFGGL
jgi:hypothetical protein